MGASARQGPHQAAQKSTMTGCSDLSTSWSKLASVTSTIASLAIHPPEVRRSSPGRGCAEPSFHRNIPTPFRCWRQLLDASSHLVAQSSLAREALAFRKLRPKKIKGAQRVNAERLEGSPPPELPDYRLNCPAKL